jgi:hypothetical protein
MKRELRKILHPNLLKALKEYDREHDELVKEVAEVGYWENEFLRRGAFCRSSTSKRRAGKEEGK